LVVPRCCYCRPDGETRLWIDDASVPILSQTLRIEYTDMRWLKKVMPGRNNSLHLQMRIARLWRRPTG
jgi:hypothetical protein